jgi:hypothetical protein
VELVIIKRVHRADCETGRRRRGIEKAEFSGARRVELLGAWVSREVEVYWVREI